MEFLLKYNLFRICKYVGVGILWGKALQKMKSKVLGVLPSYVYIFLKITFLWEIIFKRNPFNCQHFLWLKKPSDGQKNWK